MIFQDPVVTVSVASITYGTPCTITFSDSTSTTFDDIDGLIATDLDDTL